MIGTSRILGGRPLVSLEANSTTPSATREGGSVPGGTQSLGGSVQGAPSGSILRSENATLLGGMQDSSLGVTESRDGSPHPESHLPWYRRRLSTLHNFVLMCVTFSCNHGAVTSVLGISVTLLGDNGSYMDGALYVMYALTALLFATAPLDLLGSRLSLIVAAATYSIFVLAFPVSLLIPPGMPGLELAVALVGGIVGGFAAGFIWVAQGQVCTCI